jgi:hypothetical protein
VDRCDFDYVTAWDQNDDRYYQGTFLTNVPGLENNFTASNDGSPIDSADFGQAAASSFGYLNLADEYSPAQLFALAQEYIAARKADDQPFFIYYPMLLTHRPIKAPPGEPDTNDKQVNFNSQVKFADNVVGAMRATLRELGLENDTLLLFAGDNGARGDIETVWGPNSITISGEKFSLSEAGTRVSFIAEWPTVVPPGTDSDRLVDVSDFVPTLLDVLGQADAPPMKAGVEPLDGFSFLDDLQGSAIAGRGRDTVLMQQSKRHAVRNQLWQLDNDGQLWSMQPLYERSPSDTSLFCSQPAALALANRRGEMVRGSGLRFSPPGDPSFNSDCDFVVCTDGVPRCTQSTACAVDRCTSCLDASTPFRCVVCDEGFVPEPLGGYICLSATEMSTTSSMRSSSSTLTSSSSSTSTSSTSSTDMITSPTPTQTSSSTSTSSSSIPLSHLPPISVSTSSFTISTTSSSLTTTVAENTECRVWDCLACERFEERRCRLCAKGMAPSISRKYCLKQPKACNVPHCRQCERRRPNQCDVCEEGYVLSNRGRSCALPPQCKVDNCAECRRGWPKRCVHCREGYETARGGALCVSSECLVENCAVCKTRRPRRCRTCEAGYVGHNNARACKLVEP